MEKYKVSDWLSVSPSAVTARLLASKGLTFKLLPDGFAVFVKVINKKPEKNIDQTIYNFDLSFSGESSVFSALQILRMDDNQAGYYLFSNEISALKGNANASLCQLPPAYDNAKKYAGGEIVEDGGNHYLALDKIGNSNKPVSNSNFWKQIDKTIQFANASNLNKRPSLANNSSSFEILNFSELSLIPTAFGRIEISVNNQTPASFRVLNASKQVQQKTFDIRINHLY
ncbi:MAG: hypothetical protein ACO1N1_25295 [Dyadobacter fermentans]